MTQRPAGATLAELLVASFVASLLLMVILLIFRTGANAWMKVESQTDLTRTVQVITSRLSQELSLTSLASFSVGDDERSCAFSLPAQQQPAELTTDSKIVWFDYIVYYYSETEKRLFRRVVDIPAASPASRAPLPIDALGGGALPAYLQQGRNFGGPHLVKFQMRLEGLSVVLNLEAAKDRFGRTDQERFSLTTLITPRN